MNKVLKNVLRSVFPLALGGGILFWVYRDFDFSMVGSVLLGGMNWGWMLLSLVFGVLSHVIRGWRWKQTLTPMGVCPKTGNCVYAVFVAYAANLVIPRLGEVSRCAVLAKYEKIPFAQSLGTVFVERLIDALCLATIVLITLCLGGTDVFNRFLAETGIDVSHVFDGFIAVRLCLVLGCVAIAGGILYYFSSLPVGKKIKGVMRSVGQGVMSFRNITNLPLFVLFTVLIWFCYFMHFYTTFFCFPFTGHLGLWAGMILFIGGTFSVLVPTPAGAGSWHFVIISLMLLYRVNPTDAGIFALLVHGIQTFLVVLLGIYGTAMLPVMNKSKSL